MDLHETSYDHITGENYFTITASEPWSVSMVNRLHKSRPNEVQIVVVNPDGSPIAKMPFKWMKVKPTRKCNLTDEQRAQVAEISCLILWRAMACAD